MGRVAVVFLLAVALIGGVAMWYLQTRAYYTRLDTGDVVVTALDGVRQSLPHESFAGIDSDSSPLRYRACFTTEQSLESMSATTAPYPTAEPLTGPGWFACFDAAELGAALERGEARAYLGQADIIWGFDRVVAVFDDGRGMVWHQLNACGELAFDGQPLPDDCPSPPEATR